MTEVAPRERVSRRQVRKFAERREHLAAAALQTLAEQGYARTSLRDIAQHSEFSHGVLHYYFEDKVDLITYCVRRYKAERVARYDSIVATATTPEELRDRIGMAMAATLRCDAAVHRLWYDLRNQSQFDGGLPRRRAGDRPEPGADGLAHRDPVRRPRRVRAGDHPGHRLRPHGRPLPARPAAAPAGRRGGGHGPQLGVRDLMASLVAP